MGYSYADANKDDGNGMGDYSVPEYFDEGSTAGSGTYNRNDSMPSYDPSYVLEVSPKRYVAMFLYMLLITLQIYTVHTFNPLELQQPSHNTTVCQSKMLFCILSYPKFCLTRYSLTFFSSNDE
jgi:hypothetical protein